MLKQKRKFEQLVFTQKGWSLYKLAKILEVKDITVYRWNNGSVEPKPLNIRKISNAIGADISEVMACFEKS